MRYVRNMVAINCTCGWSGRGSDNDPCPRCGGIERVTKGRAMSCKHENAEHLMPGEQFATWTWLDVNITTVNFEQLRCLDCGTWLSLGPTPPDTEAVAIEKRAAELASTWDPDNASWNGFESLGMCSPDGQHADLIEQDVRDGRKSPHDLFAYLSGHLACVIASHDNDPPAQGMDRESKP